MQLESFREFKLPFKYEFVPEKQGSYTKIFSLGQHSSQFMETKYWIFTFVTY